MRVRAIKDLSRLSDPRLFEEIACGLDLVMKNVARLVAGAATLRESNQVHAGRVLSALADEEAAKYLILLDAVRCPRKPPHLLPGQLSRFNEHLAKGLYARASGYRPVRLKDLQDYIDHDRDSHYLDGPNDVDYIMRNEIIQGREGLLYVDYVQYDEDYHWTDPSRFEDMLAVLPESHSGQVARSLHSSGLGGPEALATIASVWRSATIDADTHIQAIWKLNHQTLTALEAKALLKAQPQDVYAWIVQNWQFPMYGLDLSEIRVELDDLRGRRNNWTPDF